MSTRSCPSCGAENPDRARFCLDCGKELSAATPSGPREVRKVVTILFADIAGSTSFAEDRDPEAVRAVLGRYFAGMRESIERHGGTTEKFIGDAVMAVFGLPVAHEDDAVRAVRAAEEIARTVERLNAETGTPIRIRTGLNTGEVVAGIGGSGETLVTGDTVNVAARLEQAAGPGEMLLSETTVRLVRGSVEVGPPLTLEVKGRSAPVTAHRFVRITPGGDAPARRYEAPLVGRGPESRALLEAWVRVQDDARPMLVVVTGVAGVGKSRLVREFVAEVGPSAVVLRGRCLPYGQGITFWPIGEIVRQAAGIGESDSAATARDRLRSSVAGTAEAAHVATALERLLGLGPGSSPVEELAWATRRLLEHLGLVRPVVVVIEDIHWAEPALLDLVDHVLVAGQGPILLVTPSRPEIAELRASLLDGPRTQHLALEPLGEVATSELIDRLLPGDGPVAALRVRIAEAAEGNPLYVEEMVGMLVDDDAVRPIRDGTWELLGPIGRIAMPPTIGALLTARLDRLGAERTIAERGAVIGRVFEGRAVAHLSPELTGRTLADRLETLTARDLVRPEAPGLADELAYRFRHILIRDAAYESLPKSERARLHESLADWLVAVAGERLAEIQEIVGHHLERAATYLRDLGSAPTDGVAQRASEHLGAAAVRAADRGDARAAANLFERAAELRPADDRQRERLFVELAIALNEAGSVGRAGELLDGVIERATGPGDEALRHHAVVVARTLDDVPIEHEAAILAEAERALEVLSIAGDELGVARAWHLQQNVHWFAGRGAQAETAILRALTHAQRSGRRSEVIQAYGDLSAVFNTGPIPVEEGLRRCHEIMAAQGEDRMIEAWMSHALAHLEAKRGDFAEARAHAALTRRVLEENGQTLDHAVLSELVADVEYQAGDLAAAVGYLRDGLDVYHRFGRPSAILSSHLCHVAWHAGEHGLIEESAEEGMAPGGWARAMTLGALARLRASQGRFAEAEVLVGEALEYWETTDYLTNHGWTLEALGDVRAMAGRIDEAVAALEGAIELHARKGSLVGVEKVRQRLARLHSAS